MDDLAARQFIELERDHWWFAGRRAIYFDVLRRALPPGEGRIALDVGCGAGGMLGGLSGFSRPVGLDLSPELLAQARGRGFKRLLIGSAEKLPLAPGSCGLVTAFDCIEHLDDDAAALRSFRDALAPGGRLFLSVPAWQSLYADNDRVAHHKRRYRRGELVAKARAAGFTVERASYVNAWLFPLIVPAVLLLKLKQRLRPRELHAAETNLSYRLPRWLNGLLAAIFASERWLLRLGDLPLGHSLLLLARKGDAELPSGP